MGKRLGVLMVAGLLLVAGCSEDEGGAGSRGAEGDGEQPGETSEEAGGSGAGGGAGTGGSGASAGDYSDEVRSEFVSSCATQPGAVRDSEERCSCAFDHIAETMPFDEFRAYREAAREDPAAPPPEGVLAALAVCIR